MLNKKKIFSTFSAPYRYEGIILINKNSNIHNLADLKGKKSCHTGFGRNVGYKIPITKLKKNGLLRMSPNPLLSSVERELKALSEFFGSSCLVGTYSPNEDTNRLLSIYILGRTRICIIDILHNMDHIFYIYRKALCQSM